MKGASRAGAILNFLILFFSSSCSSFRFHPRKAPDPEPLPAKTVTYRHILHPVQVSATLTPDYLPAHTPCVDLSASGAMLGAGSRQRNQARPARPAAGGRRSTSSTSSRSTYNLIPATSKQ